MSQPQLSPEGLVIAEQVIAREEAASERAFDPAFRARTKLLLAGLPMEQLAQVQAQESGLGLNVLGDSQADLVYTPVAPCRIIDTRHAGGALSASVPRSFKVTGDTTSQGGANCGIPFGPATGAVINFVAVGATAPGDLRITPFGTALPLASILNWAGGVPGLNLANGLAVALCNPSAKTCTEDITLQADASDIHIVADVQGYFENVSTGGIGTALLADGAVTAAKIAGGAVVKSLSGQTDTVTLAGTNGLSVTAGSGTVTVTSNATNANTPSTIVSRDGSGNFTAGTITASLNGSATSATTATTATTATNFSGSLAGEVTGTQVTTFVSSAISTNTASAIVRRDTSGGFLAGTVGLAGNLGLPNTASASVGVLTMGGAPFLHNYGSGNTFLGGGAGNLSLTGQSNTAVGASALAVDTSGNQNAAFGSQALSANTTGRYNLALGQSAGANHVSGDNNVFIAAAGPDTESGAIRIGTSGTHTATYIAGIWPTTLGTSRLVTVDASGQMGSTTGVPLADGSVTTPKLADAAVTSVKLADGSVTAAKIGSGVVVKSLNSQTDVVSLAGTNGLSVSQGSGTVTVTSNATSAGTPNTIVARDSSGNFAAGTITASLNGNASSATTATNFSGSLAGEVTGTQLATVVSNAVSTNTASAIVRRDTSGGFLAGTVGLAGNLGLPNTASASVGVLTLGGAPFLHNYGTNNTFVGASAGNTSLTGTGNSAFGYTALTADTSGAYNSAFGHQALVANTTGTQNSAFGYGALSSFTTGNYNSAFGVGALAALANGNRNIAVGYRAGRNLPSGDDNIYLGNPGVDVESGAIRIGAVGTHKAAYVAGISGVTPAGGSPLPVVIDANGQLGTSSSVGDITSVNTPAGGGLQGGATSGDVNLSLVTCASGQVLKSGGSTWSCAADLDTGVNQVVNGGGVTGSIAARTLTLGSTATSANTANAIVARDDSGSFSAESVSLLGNLTALSVSIAATLNLSNTGSASWGVLTMGGTPFLHDYGMWNTFVGSGAGNFTLTGDHNSAFGANALSNTTTGASNSAFGSFVLQADTSGSFNSAFGDFALYKNTTGHENSAFGAGTLNDNTTGYENSAFGEGALYANTTGNFNSAFGTNTLYRNTSGTYNSAFGYFALYNNTQGQENSAFGMSALSANTTGGSNSAFGDRALQAATTSFGDTAVGYGALQHANGIYNTALGYSAGYKQHAGQYNIYIDNDGTDGESGTIHIGNSNHTATYIAGIYNATSASGTAVYVNSSGQLGTTTSSRRYKEQIADVAGESDVLMKLRPVSFYYRPELDQTHTRQYGLVAEEVAEIAPELVAYDKDGSPQTVRYHFVNAMLLNEVQKQRRQIQDLEARLAKLEAALAGDH